jgi:hypothetical protein
MKLRIVGVVAVIVLGVTACGGGSSGTPVAQPTVSSPPVVSATPSPVIPAGPKGILVGESNTITAYDPVTHQPTATTIPNMGTKAGSCGALARQSYSPTFDKEVWCESTGGAGWGSGTPTSIGYTDVPSGVLHNLTPPKASNYGSVAPRQRLPIFNPKTGDLWFYDDNLKSFMSFDLSSPGSPPQKRSDHPVSVNGLDWPSSLGAGPLLFSADGSTLVDTTGNVVVSPDGKVAIIGSTVDCGVPCEIAKDTSHVTLVKLDGLPTESNASAPPRTTTDAPPSAVSLKWPSGAVLDGCNVESGLVFIDSNSFLCSGYVRTNSGSAGILPGSTTGTLIGTSLYKLTINGSTLTSLNLLPASENDVGGFIVSPDKKSAAFVASVVSGSDQLFTVSLDGGEPTLIGPLTRGASLIEWR